MAPNAAAHGLAITDITGMRRGLPRFARGSERDHGRVSACLCRIGCDLPRARSRCVFGLGRETNVPTHHVSGGVERRRFSTTCDTAATMNSQERNKLRAGAKRRCRLLREARRTAQELGLNLRSRVHNIPSPQEPWKAPVEVWARRMYAKRHRGHDDRRAVISGGRRTAVLIADRSKAQVAQDPAGRVLDDACPQLRGRS
jgi:hypothetical protein